MQLLGELVRGDERVGSRIAALLAGSWRASSPPPFDGDAAALVPLLLRSGAAALASRRAPLPELKQAWRLTSLHAELHAQRLAAVASALRAAGVTAILGKGWAVAALYPDAALRPYGDFDLYVPPDEIDRARRALDGVEAPVDLHAGFADAGDAGEVRARARPLEDIDLLRFGDEDHLRLLCVHLLKHGAWRPLWLCDVAVAVEQTGRAFDWGYLSSVRGDWVRCAIGLARELLGANVDVVTDGGALPRWLVPTVLRQWGDARFVPQGARTPMRDLLGQPRAMVTALRQRWPNAIEATVGVGARFDDRPRLPLQLAECARRAITFSRSLLDPRAAATAAE